TRTPRRDGAYEDPTTPRNSLTEPRFAVRDSRFARPCPGLLTTVQTDARPVRRCKDAPGRRQDDSSRSPSTETRDTRALEWNRGERFQADTPLASGDRANRPRTVRHQSSRRRAGRERVWLRHRSVVVPRLARVHAPLRRAGRD